MNLFKNMKRSTVMLGIAVMLMISAAGAAYAIYSGYSNRVSHSFTIQPGGSNQTNAGTLEDAVFKSEDNQNLLPGSEMKSEPTLTSNVKYDADYVVKVTYPNMKKHVTGKYYEYLSPIEIVGLSEKLSKYKEVIEKKEGGNVICYFEGKEPIRPDEKLAPFWTTLRIKDFDTLENAIKGEISISVSMRQHTESSLTNRELLKEVLSQDGQSF